MTRTVAIWVDADACPRVIRDILFRAAIRVGVPLNLVANHALPIPNSPLIRNVQVAQGFDVADNLIAEPFWSPDGQTLLLTAFQLNDEWAKPRVWLINVATSEQTELAHPGSFPTWQW